MRHGTRDKTAPSVTQVSFAEKMLSHAFIISE